MEVKCIREVDKYNAFGKNLLILYLLNISDLFFTKFLLYKAPDLFVEANVFLNPIIDGAIPYILKIVVIAAVLLYWYIRSKNSTVRQLKRSLVVGKIFIFLYLGINAMHLFNFIVLINFI